MTARDRFAKTAFSFHWSFSHPSIVAQKMEASFEMSRWAATPLALAEATRCVRNRRNGFGARSGSGADSECEDMVGGGRASDDGDNDDETSAADDGPEEGSIVCVGVVETRSNDGCDPSDGTKPVGHMKSESDSG